MVFNEISLERLYGDTPDGWFLMYKHRLRELNVILLIHDLLFLPISTIESRVS